MHYTSFTIEGYRAISKPLTIDLKRSNLVPIIGVNESGKTTILQALQAFDQANDQQAGGRHLDNVQNLYDPNAHQEAGTVSAEIAVGDPASFKELVEHTRRVLEEAKAKAADAEKEQYDAQLREIASLQDGDAPSHLIVCRNLGDRVYRLSGLQQLPDGQANQLLAEKIIESMPYLLYFDDFRDVLREPVSLKKDTADGKQDWRDIFQRLFRATESSFTIYDLPRMDPRTRRTQLDRVNRKLNDTLALEWEKFSLDEQHPLRVELHYESTAEQEGKLAISVVETGADGGNYHFDVPDRSKGFFWFFNFVMKLEFNPKTLDEHGRYAVYLLDEPGSFLHASAQVKLCSMIRDLAKHSAVIYCTHSHYLLDPAVVPLNQLLVAEKDDDGAVVLTPFSEHKDRLGPNAKIAFQPVIQALRVPLLYAISGNRCLVVEGMEDYYVFKNFVASVELTVIPCTGADSITYAISLLIASDADYRALWDNDEDGRRGRERAVAHFGDLEAKNFCLLPVAGDQAKRIVQDLFHGEDVRMIKERVGLQQNASFGKALAALHYAENKAETIAAVSQRTRRRIEEVIKALEYA